jgi:Mg-chelatase subunit ChlD
MKTLYVILLTLLCSTSYGQSIVPINSTHWLHKARSAKALDLPVAPPKLGGAPWYDLKDPTPEPAPEDDDPRDTPPPVFFGEEIDSASDSVVIVIDDSGSMRGSRAAKAVVEAARFIQSLSKDYRFTVVKFNCGSNAWRNECVEATRRNKTSARNWLSGIRGRGGTGTGPAVERALQMDKSNLHILLLTDGAPGCASASFKTKNRFGRITYQRFYMGLEEHSRMIREANTQGAKIDVFGIMAYGDYRSWCQSVAGESGGSYIDVP